ncbi:hypothetical protein [Filifactor alocis]|uniref:hypothetical protein n=1 Tax=Filifactor alocis TaxID=143361 RepID=UPI003FA0594F
MPRWFWTLLWVSQVIEWIVTIWAYGTVNGSCILAPMFTIAWVLKDEVAECYTTLFTDDWEYEEEEECNPIVIDRRYDYYQLKKGA